eukprot:290221-Chlamydomonas_euryale.AAC.3
MGLGTAFAIAGGMCVGGGGRKSPRPAQRVHGRASGRRRRHAGRALRGGPPAPLLATLHTKLALCACAAAAAFAPGGSSCAALQWLFLGDHCRGEERRQSEPECGLGGWDWAARVGQAGARAARGGAEERRCRTSHVHADSQAPGARRGRQRQAQGTAAPTTAAAAAAAAATAVALAGNRGAAQARARAG